MANGVEVAKAFVTIVPTTKGAQDAIASSIVPAAKSGGTKAGAAMGAATTGGLVAALKKFAIPAAVLAAFVGLGKFASNAFKDVEKGANNVIKATGATGDKAKELTDVYKNVSRSVVGDLGEIGAAVGELNTRLGLEGKDLEEASEAMMKYSKVTGQDATKETKDVASMMRNAGIPTDELEQTLGKLTVAGQAAGIDVSKLANNTTKYNAVMKKLGLSTDEQIALMAKFEQSGADTASILNAMKKGVANWAKEGKDAKTEFQNFVQGVQDGTVTAGDAVEIFGSRGGLSMYEAAQKGQLSFEEMYETISKASGKNLDQVYKDTLTNEERMQLAFQNIKLAAADVFTPLAEATAYVLGEIVVPALQTFSAWVHAAMESGAGQVITDAFNTIREAAERLWVVLQPSFEYVKERFAEMKPMLEDAVTSFSNIAVKLIDFLSVVLPPAIEFVSGTIELFVWVLSQALQGIDAVLSAIGSLSTTIPQTWEKIKADAAAAWESIKTGVTNFWNSIDAAFRNGGAAVRNAAKSAVDFVKRVFNGLKSIPTIARNIFNAVKTAIVTPINAARNTIRGIIDAIKGFFSNFEIPTPHIPLPHFEISPYDWGIGDLLQGIIPSLDIDWYAKGAVFPANAPRLVGMGDAKVPEAAAPLDKLGEMIDEYVNADNADVVALLKAILDKDSNIYLDGRELANSTVGYTDKALGARQLTANRGVAQ